MEKSYLIRRQCYEDAVRPFTCGDSDLDDFFRNDSLHYSQQKLATSYVVEDDTEVLAYFAIANDRISVEDFQQSSSFNRFRKRFVNSKRLRGYPAVKLCRLAVNDRFKRNGFRPLNDAVDLNRYTVPMYFDLADMDQHLEA